MLQIGNKCIDSIYFGNNTITEAYLGSVKIWPMIPIAIKNSMVLWYDTEKQGCTNDGMFTNPILTDFSGNGRNAICYNFAWDNVSGINEEVDFTESYDENTEYGIVTSNSITLVKVGSFGYVYDENLPDTPGHIIKVTGLTENINLGEILSLVLYYKQSDGVENQIVLTADGIYTIPASYNSVENTGYSHSITTTPGTLNNNDDLSIPIVIKLLSYPNALISDGVNDYCSVSNLPLFNSTDGYTIIAKRHIILNNGATAGKSTEEENGAFVFEESGNTRSFGNSNKINIVETSDGISWQTSTSYNGVQIAIGSNEDTSADLTLFTPKSENSGYSQMALYSLILFDRDLTTDEIDWVVQNLMKLEDFMSNAIAILTSEDNTVTKYFSSCSDAAAYATENSDTNWSLIIRSGEVPNSCFSNTTNLISLTLEEGVTSIGNYAFRGCTGLTGSLVIPDSVTSIGQYAFRGCTGFTGSLTIGNSVTRISTHAFHDCSGFNGNLTIPDSVTSIDTYAFYNCSGFNGNLTIPDSVTRINGSAFYNCSGLTGSLVIPSSVTSIGSSAFYGCSGFDDDLSYYGINNPGTYDTVFSNSSFTFCKVLVDYEDDTFCGLPVRKVIAPNGVYIYTLDGTLSTITDWNTDYNDNALGVAVITDNTKFLLSRIHVAETDIPWSVNLSGSTLGSVYATTEAAALADYLGLSNTQIIHESAPDESTANNAAKWCITLSGEYNNIYYYIYLPAYGEVNEMCNNRETIDNALTLLGSELTISLILSVSTARIMSSTSYSDTMYHAYSTSGMVLLMKSTRYNNAYLIPLITIDNIIRLT